MKPVRRPGGFFAPSPAKLKDALVLVLAAARPGNGLAVLPKPIVHRILCALAPNPAEAAKHLDPARYAADELVEMIWHRSWARVVVWGNRRGSKPASEAETPAPPAAPPASEADLARLRVFITHRGVAAACSRDVFARLATWLEGDAAGEEARSFAAALVRAADKPGAASARPARRIAAPSFTGDLLRRRPDDADPDLAAALAAALDGVAWAAVARGLPEGDEPLLRALESCFEWLRALLRFARAAPATAGPSGAVARAAAAFARPKPTRGVARAAAASSKPAPTRAVARAAAAFAKGKAKGGALPALPAAERGRLRPGRRASRPLR